MIIVVMGVVMVYCLENSVRMLYLLHFVGYVDDHLFVTSIKNILEILVINIKEVSLLDNLTVASYDTKSPSSNSSVNGAKR